MLAVKVCEYVMFVGWKKLAFVSCVLYSTYPAYINYCTYIWYTCLFIFFKVLPPAVHLRVTENIPQIVAFIEGIIRNEHAYATKQGMSICKSNFWYILVVTFSSQDQFANSCGIWIPCVHSAARDVYFGIRSIGVRYGKLMGAGDAAGEPGTCLHHFIVTCFCHTVTLTSFVFGRLQSTVCFFKTISKAMID